MKVQIFSQGLRTALQRIFSCLLLSHLLLSCSPRKYVPVEERQTLTVRAEMDKVGGQLIRFVQPGDTLYSISFAAGLDVKQVAAWNNLLDTSRLTVGQRIRLTKPVGFVPRDANNKTVNESAVLVRPVKSGAAPSASASAKPRNSKTKPRVWNKHSNWVWPVNGKLIKRFNMARGRQQGIDIKARFGEPVIACGAGQVVYVGNGLKGYGNLVIIKHSEHYLSAYAHNNETFVREGDEIKSSQVIASVGTNNQNIAALHFQIRKDGRPVDPLHYLSNK